MKQLKHILPMLAVIIWFTHYNTSTKPTTEIDVWPDAERVLVSEDVAAGILRVTPWWTTYGFFVSIDHKGPAYNAVRWTVIEDNAQATVYINELKEEYKDIAPVDDIKRLPEADTKVKK